MIVGIEVDVGDFIRISWSDKRWTYLDEIGILMHVYDDKQEKGVCLLQNTSRGLVGLDWWFFKRIKVISRLSGAV